MEFTKNRFDMLVATDGSDIQFPVQQFPQYPELPINVMANHAGHVSLILPQAREINLADCEVIKCVEFGEARQAGSGSKWTGNAYRYIVAKIKEESSQPMVLVVEISGTGPHFYYIQGLDFLATIELLCKNLPEPRLWDLLHALVGTYQEAFKQGAIHTKMTYHQAFAEGRLKKRKVRNQEAYDVWIERKPS